MNASTAIEKIAEVLVRGDERSNGMAVRLCLPSGLEIFGFATRNTYGGDWDIGPTWNYLVTGDQPFLLDAGRWGTGDQLVDMIRAVGLAPADIATVVVSHGHEDHDGGLHAVATATGAEVRAHRIYECLRQVYPEHAPRDFRSQFPAACWRCFMPESFSETHCRDYQRRLGGLEVADIEGDGWAEVHDLEVLHVPGHTPDSVALLVGDEVLLAGDTVLPDITPAPSQEAFHDDVRPVLPGEYDTPGSVYGLRAYLRSLKRLAEAADRTPGLMFLPGHRLFWNGRWHDLNLAARLAELSAHHLHRCGAILEILSRGPLTATGIAARHFEPHLLRGLGARMAENEILSHCELLVAAGDLAVVADRTFEASGSSRFERLISDLEAA